jgi:hypothetical protein
MHMQEKCAEIISSLKIRENEPFCDARLTITVSHVAVRESPNTFSWNLASESSAKKHEPHTTVSFKIGDQ